MSVLKSKLQQLLIHKNDNLFVQFLRSLFVGGLATLVDFTIFYLLAIRLHLNPNLATTISFIFGMVVNYYFTQIWVFSYTPPNLTKSFTVFAIIGVVGLILNNVLLYVMINYHILEDTFKIVNQDYIKLLAKTIATIIVYVWNFSSRKYFIFREIKETIEIKEIKETIEIKETKEFRETKVIKEKAPVPQTGFRAFYQRNRSLLLALLILVIAYYFLYLVVKQDVFSHDSHDSFTIQANAWWGGRADLGRDYPWLELAFFHQKVFVSFPPVPSIPMFLLIPFFKENTPDNLLTTIYTLLAFSIIYLFCKRRGATDTKALFWSFFLVMGGNLVPLSVSGSVWFQEQVLCFLLTSLSLYLITSAKRSSWHLGLACWALAIGCRPFQALYFPIYLYFLVDNLKKQHEINKFTDLFKLVPFAILPVVIFMGYGWYNWIRFQNPFEFGHNYLPEFMHAQYGQFSFNYLFSNYPNIFRLPNLITGTSRLTFPRYDGFLFLIANPIFIPFFTRLIRSIIKKELTFYDFMLPVLIVMHIILFLCHRTLGGWQFGVRYFIDFLPFIFLYIYQKQPKVYRYEIGLLAFGVILNIYGTAWLYLNWA